LYVYSKYIYETYGEYPVGLIFNMFRKGDIVREPFSVEEYKKALSWAESTIDMIYEDKHFKDKVFLSYLAKRKDIKDFKKDDFFCNSLCSVRKSCPRAKK